MDLSYLDFLAQENTSSDEITYLAQNLQTVIKVQNETLHVLSELIDFVERMNNREV